MNAGHRKGATIPRCVGPDQTVVHFPVFAALALAGIGNLPTTLLTRCVVIRMRRRSPKETVEPFRHRIALPYLAGLQEELLGWAAQIADRLSTTYPTLPDGVTDRSADVWEPLIAVADAAGGEWPQRARAACTELVGHAEVKTVSLGIRLLEDLRTVFGKQTHLWTTTVIDRLKRLDESPWESLYGVGLDSLGLANLLKQYGVKSKSVREDGVANAKSLKGYDRADLHDPWSRYLSDTPAEASQPTHETQPSSERVDPVSPTDPVSPADDTTPADDTRSIPLTCGVSAVSPVTPLRTPGTDPDVADPEDLLASFAEEIPPNELGPCVRCHTKFRRYGPRGEGALCAACRNGDQPAQGQPDDPQPDDEPAGQQQTDDPPWAALDELTEIEERVVGQLADGRAAGLHIHDVESE